ncbi:MAG TPA: ferritin-like domain-containing protein, partial [Chloroflexi bacterium]|nr:ferritin-like domain-containing protein [Chloroflexota bacterium]
VELQAINEMQHMGWLAEELAALGQDLPLEHHKVDLSQELPSMLQADVKLEKGTAEMYGKYLQWIEEPELRGLLEHIRDHELYHEKLFIRFLEGISK